MLAEDDALAIYTKAGAAWFFPYKKNPRKTPHTRTTFGLCTDGYVDSDLVMSAPGNVEILSKALIEKVRERVSQKIDWVVGSEVGGIVPSFKVAELLGARHGIARKTKSKEPDAAKFAFAHAIPPRSVVLRVEELVTTFGTASGVRGAVELRNPRVNILPFAAVFFYRPSGDPVPHVLSLITRRIKTWPPNQCPLCGQGSPLVENPKLEWEKLVS